MVMVRVQALECAGSLKVHSNEIQCLLNVLAHSYTCLLTAVKKDLEGRAVIKVS